MTAAASKNSGAVLSQSLIELLEVLPSQAEEKLVEGVSKCFGRGHPLPEDPSTDGTAQIIRNFVEQLQKHPTRRHFVVDRDNLVTDDASWLTLAACDVPSTNTTSKQPLQWAITTVRSLERSVYEHCYTTDCWKIQHATGPRGSAVVTKKRGAPTTATENDSDTKNVAWCHQVFFSDMPKCVAATGRQLGNLYPSQLVVRVLRTAPRSSLNSSVQRILQQSHMPDNIFTLWIRHHETIADLPGLGRYRYEKVNDERTVLELLTEIVDEEEDANRPTSPLAYDFVQASQASLQRCRPPIKPSTANDVPKKNFTFGTRSSKPADGVGESPSNNKSTECADSVAPECSRSETNSSTGLEESPSNTPTEFKTLASSTDQNLTAPDTVAEVVVPEPSISGKSVDTVDNSTQPSICEKAGKITLKIDLNATSIVASEQEESGNETPLNTSSISAQMQNNSSAFSTPMKENSTVDSSQLRAEKTVSLTEPESLGQKDEGSVASSPVDTQYDDLEIMPSFSFDETDANPTVVEHYEKAQNNAETEHTESVRSDRLTPENIAGDDSCMDEPNAAVNSSGSDVRGTQNAQESCELKTSDSDPSNILSHAEENAGAVIQPDTDLRKEKVESESSAQPSADPQSAQPANTVMVEDSSAAPIRSPKRKPKTLKCTGCGTRKEKSAFSNNQLRKKKNQRCLDCVRANRLGSSTTN